jgi:hypothetical protein
LHQLPPDLLLMLQLLHLLLHLLLHRLLHRLLPQLLHPLLMLLLHLLLHLPWLFFGNSKSIIMGLLLDGLEGDLVCGADA